MHDKLRLVHVHLHIGICLVQLPADVLAELYARHGEALVTALGLHLEALRAQHFIAQVFLRQRGYRVLVLLAGRRAHQCDYAEHVLQRLERRVDIGVVLLRLHIYGGLDAVDPELPYMRKPAAHIRHKLLLKIPAVQPLQDYFAELYEYYVVHSVLPRSHF